MSNLEMMRKRLEYQGGIAQDHRMIKDKLRTFHKALKYSYQSCNVIKVQPYIECFCVDDPIDTIIGESKVQRALINPDKLKQDYDDKILSIDYESDFQCGDVFRWNEDKYNFIDQNKSKKDSYWIIYLQELTEDSYFRADIRRCRYQIKYRDEDGKFWKTWAAIRGPVETQIDSIQKNQLRLDRPNLSLNILVPKNEKNLMAFERYKEFLLEGRCWRVEAFDSISMKNIIEVNAEEYFIDRDTDDEKEELKNGLIVEPIESESEIIGPTYIKPKITEIYTAPDYGGRWCIVEDSAPVILTPKGGNKVEITWDRMTTSKFTLRWCKDGIEMLKEITVESLM